ncbi:hypothetical protein HOV93_47240 [Planctomycetes bacterium FF15]|uniref:Uncharacterized protein n=1 Tax=Bremerella alba TaxID=980252 RepID=A0A7V8V9T3_9BACT|nr:hypothetical protein [Bremerella alba]
MPRRIDQDDVVSILGGRRNGGRSLYSVVWPGDTVYPSSLFSILGCATAALSSVKW